MNDQHETNSGPAAKERTMPKTAEITFPTEAHDRLKLRRSQRTPEDPGADRDEILHDAMAVIDHLESDNTALRNTIDFMRDRVKQAVAPR